LRNYAIKLTFQHNMTYSILKRKLGINQLTDDILFTCHMLLHIAKRVTCSSMPQKFHAYQYPAGWKKQMNKNLLVILTVCEHDSGQPSYVAWLEHLVDNDSTLSQRLARQPNTRTTWWPSCFVIVVKQFSEMIYNDYLFIDLRSWQHTL